jgi:Tfp pilus assembly protein PilN
VRDVRRLKTLSLIMLTTWLAVAGSYVAHLHRAERALDETLLRLREPVASVRALTARVRSVEQMNAVLAHSARAGASVTRTVASVIVALPDSAYLTSLAVDAAGTAMIAGAAREPAEVQAAIERGTRLSGIHSEEPGTFGDGMLGRRWVRFDLRAGRP